MCLVSIPVYIMWIVQKLTSNQLSSSTCLRLEMNLLLTRRRIRSSECTANARCTVAAQSAACALLVHRSPPSQLLAATPWPPRAAHRQKSRCYMIHPPTPRNSGKSISSTHACTAWWSRENICIYRIRKSCRHRHEGMYIMSQLASSRGGLRYGEEV